jgi:2-succinyl-5-enolpyruvyl-6-hydroxy-3-cyclohexene-1-carboxylate synthase
MPGKRAMSAPLSQPNINTLWSDVIAAELACSGVRDVVISPGSRSTPLVLACAQHPDLATHSQLDERSAGFYALGLARASRRPVALICTSGTAAANYYPAVCEAEASAIPLLLLTADRPAHLRHSGAPQTMNQVRLYGDRVRFECDFAQPEAEEERLRGLRATVCHAVAMTGAPLPGPVHCNVPFRKPLEPLPAVRAQDQLPDALRSADGGGVRGRRSGLAWTRYIPADAALATVADALLRAARPVIIAGPDADGDAYAEILLALAAGRNIPVLAEAASQLRFRSGKTGIGSVDLLLRSAAFRDRFHPDCILLLGGTATSAGMLRFFEECDDVEVICVAPDRRRRDPAHRVSLHVHGDVPVFLTRLSRLLDGRPVSPRTDWLRLFALADAAARDALRRELDALDGELEGVFLDAMAAQLRHGTPLMLSSSMPIRDVETFVPALPAHIPVHVNRGVNGIDGVLSTALGMVRGSGRRGVLCIGDVAFLHNLNATLGDGLAALPLTVVLLNNDGGEIFDLLPVRDFEPAFTRHFITPHGTDLAAVARALGLQSHRAATRKEFTDAWSAAEAADGCAVIEVRTDIAKSGTLRRALLARVADAVSDAVGGETVPERAEYMPQPALHLLRAGAGTPVLLLHGFTRSHRSWIDVAAQLEEGPPLFAVDLMGHGTAPQPDPAEYASAYTLEYAADALEALCARWGFDRLHCVGYSMGGRTALAFTVRFPQRSRSLALISANPGIEDDDTRAERSDADEETAQKIERDGLETFVSAWSSGPMFAAQRDSDPRRWAAAMRDRRGSQVRGLAASLRGGGQGRQSPMWTDLPRLDMPVLVAAGESDDRYAYIAARMKALLPKAELRVFDGAGHDLPFDRGHEIAALLAALWKRA